MHASYVHASYMIIMRQEAQRSRLEASPQKLGSIRPQNAIYLPTIELFLGAYSRFPKSSHALTHSLTPFGLAQLIIITIMTNYIMLIIMTNYIMTIIMTNYIVIMTIDQLHHQLISHGRIHCTKRCLFRYSCSFLLSLLTLLLRLLSCRQFRRLIFYHDNDDGHANGYDHDHDAVSSDA